MIAGHIDALTARLKPTSTKPNTQGYIQLGVAQYAGALNETWWDRDLSIGGRVIIRDPLTGKTTVKLAKLDWPSTLKLMVCSERTYCLIRKLRYSCENTHIGAPFWHWYDGPQQPRGKNLTTRYLRQR